MNKDRVVGIGKQVAGSAKSTTGKIIGDSKLQAEGDAEKLDGKIQNAVGGLKDTLKK